jgi:hypothetical protein
MQMQQPIGSRMYARIRRYEEGGLNANAPYGRDATIQDDCAGVRRDAGANWTSDRPYLVIQR